VVGVDVENEVVNFGRWYSEHAPGPTQGGGTAANTSTGIPLFPSVALGGLYSGGNGKFEAVNRLVNVFCNRGRVANAMGLLVGGSRGDADGEMSTDGKQLASS
jgi:hypothetical protein